MCIVIDINALSNVFDPKNPTHNDFKPVFDWIFEGKGKVVYGGTKYIEELSKTRYLPLILQLRKAQKGIYIDTKHVDREEVLVSKRIQHRDFNDQHLVALLKVSKCKLFCSLDITSYQFIRHNKFFKTATRKPKIYRGVGNRVLLCDKNIASICQPCLKTTNVQRGLIEIIWHSIISYVRNK